MDRLNMQTANLADENFKKLQELFPNAVTETIDADGKLVRAIDKDILMQEISTEVVEGREERYQFTWPDKKQAILTANAPITKTLRPCREESVNFDETENLYIEGDNLDVLKLLQETYLGKIKMIYIDPPYNTGNDFVYNDNFSIDRAEYMEDSGQYDEEGNRLEKNLESNGRFHTDWLNMIYPRLRLARNLLADDGVIFISIDDNEIYNLRKVCDQIFGENNFIANIVRTTGATRAMAKHFDIRHDYVVVYTKNKGKFYLNELRNEETDQYKNYDNDKNGPWDTEDLTVRTGGHNYIIPSIDGNEKFNRNWRYSLNELKKMMGFSSEIEFEEIYKTAHYVKEKGWYTIGPFVFKGHKNIINRKKYKSKVLTLKNHTLPKKIGSNKSGGNIVKRLFNTDKEIFEKPKPVELLSYLIYIGSNKDSVIIDFFSGSGTAAHAVMDLNAEDGGSRKFIMVQIPEETDEKSEAYKAGYKNMCEIGKERIRRAGKKIIEENKDKEGIENLDIGFRVLKTDTTNMKDVYYSPVDTEQSFLDNLTDNIKEDRTAEDLLFQVMLDLGISLSSKIQVEEVGGKEIFMVEDGFLLACFDENISEETVKAIAEGQPYYAVFRDSSMGSDSLATNFDQIFESLSPHTIRKVI